MNREDFIKSTGALIGLIGIGKFELPTIDTPFLLFYVARTNGTEFMGSPTVDIALHSVPTTTGTVHTTISEVEQKDEFVQWMALNETLEKYTS